MGSLVIKVFFVEFTRKQSKLKVPVPLCKQKSSAESGLTEMASFICFSKHTKPPCFSASLGLLNTESGCPNGCTEHVVLATGATEGQRSADDCDILYLLILAEAHSISPLTSDKENLCQS